MLLPFALMLMQSGVNPATGQIPGIPEELRDRLPRGGVVGQREAAPPAIVTCLETARTDPAKAIDLATEWVSRTSGAQRAAGNHCLGVAASNAGDWESASTAFLAARDEADNARFKARMGTLAGTALLAQDEPAEALAVLDAARAEVAGDASIGGENAIERAIALVALDRAADAGAALAEARGLAPDNPNAWLLSATLARRQGDLAEAQRQIQKAAELNPVDPAIGLEAGVIAALAGNDAAARKSFDSVIAAAPDSEQAATAKSYLAQLSPQANVGTEEGSKSQQVAQEKTQ